MHLLLDMVEVDVCSLHRWARLLKQPNVNYSLSFFDQGKETYVFRMQKINGGSPFPFPGGGYGNGSIYICRYIHTYLYIIYISLFLYQYIYMLQFQRENASPGDFLNPFTVFSSCKTEVCPLSVCLKNQAEVILLQMD